MKGGPIKFDWISLKQLSLIALGLLFFLFFSFWSKRRRKATVLHVCETQAGVRRRLTLREISARESRSLGCTQSDHFMWAPHTWTGRRVGELGNPQLHAPPTSKQLHPRTELSQHKWHQTSCIQLYSKRKADSEWLTVATRRSGGWVWFEVWVEGPPCYPYSFYGTSHPQKGTCRCQGRVPLLNTSRKRLDFKRPQLCLLILQLNRCWRARAARHLKASFPLNDESVCRLVCHVEVVWSKAFFSFFLIPEVRKNVRIFQIGGRKVEPEVALAQISKHRLFSVTQKRTVTTSPTTYYRLKHRGHDLSTLCGTTYCGGSKRRPTRQRGRGCSTRASQTPSAASSPSPVGLLPSLDLRAVGTNWMEPRKGDVAHQPSGIASSQRLSRHTRHATCGGRQHQNNPAHALVGEHTVWWSGGPSSCRLDAFSVPPSRPSMFAFDILWHLIVFLFTLSSCWCKSKNVLD